MFFSLSPLNTNRSAFTRNITDIYLDYTKSNKTCENYYFRLYAVIDGVETNVFNIPTKNVLYPNHDSIDLEKNDTTSPLYHKYVLKITKEDMNTLIRITDFYPNRYYLVFK